MKTFTHSVIAQNETVAVSTQPSYDLPVNPLSFILLTLRFAQNLANTQLAFANIAAMLSKVEVLYKGSAIFSMSGPDLFALNIMINGFESWGINANGDDNELRSYTYLIPFGRGLYLADECFPKTQRGELVLQITYAAAFTNIDGVTAQIEAVELNEATPSKFMKCTTLAVTPAATGQLDIQLPTGNLITDLILFGTTIPTGSTATVTIGDVQIRRNNSEYMYGKTNFETLHNMAGIWTIMPTIWGSHIHQIDGAAFAQYMDSSPVKQNDHVLSNYLHMVFDVDRTLEYALDAKDVKDLVLRVTAGDLNAIRVVPCEIVGVAG
jgi:hypothetical protein